MKHYTTIILIVMGVSTKAFRHCTPGPTTTHRHSSRAIPALYSRYLATKAGEAQTENIFSDIGLLWDRLLDSAEDASLHLRRLARGAALSRATDASDELIARSETRRRVVVLGTGWSAHALAKIIDEEACKVIVISPRNHFTFTPMLAGSAVGTVDFRSICEPIRHANPFIDYFEASAEEIFPDNRTVRIRSEVPNEFGNKEQFMVSYDFLVYAAGSTSNTFGIPGVKENCLFLKEVPDAMRIRRALLDAFERASMPGYTLADRKRFLKFCVVGAGPTGVEFAGGLHDYIRKDLARVFPKLVKHVTLQILQATDTILPVFTKAMRQRAMETLQAEGIEVRLNTAVTQVKEKEIVLRTNETIPYGLCIWAAGTGPRALTKDLISKIPEQAECTAGAKGRLLVDAYHRVKGANCSIFALGDACEVEGGPLPATGQVAAQQGAYLARLFSRGFDLTLDLPRYPIEQLQGLQRILQFLKLRGQLSAQPFRFLNLGLLAYLGDQQALASVSAGNNIKLGDAAGQAGNILWHSVYLTKQVSTRNRIYVAIDWLKTRFFGRDISRF